MVVPAPVPEAQNQARPAVSWTASPALGGNYPTIKLIVANPTILILDARKQSHAPPHATPLAYETGLPRPFETGLPRPGPAPPS